MTAENTLRAIKSFRKFYPDVPLIVVDDDSNEEDKSEFFICYNSHGCCPEKMYDLDISKLKSIDKNTIFLQVPRHKHYGKGEGNAIDLAMKNMNTPWMFHFHSDYRFTSGGAIEELLSHVDDKTCAVGEDKKKHPQLPALSGVVELVNVDLGKKHNLSYKPVYYFDDGRTLPYPESQGSEGSFPVAAGGYYAGRLWQLGYKVITLGGMPARYGTHLRWKEDEEKWNGSF